MRHASVGWRSKRSHTALALLCALLGSAAAGCGSDAGPGRPTDELVAGQSEFESAPPNGSGNGGVNLGGDAQSGGDGAAPPAAGPGGGGGAPRKVEETDLYRLEGDRLFYLNQYRGLMVFDVSNVDAPRLLGRSPIYGYPVEMIVRDGVANVVVADWYGALDDGTPFHGSIVRGIDASDPANMRVLGEAKLGGWVKDTRVVGDVLYAVTEKYPWDYGWFGSGDGVAVGGVSTGGGSTAKVSVASVNFAGGRVEAVDEYDVPGYGGVFNVTAESILLASDILTNVDQNGYGTPTGQSTLRYLDISDPGGVIVERGSAVVNGSIQSWGADYGRWNLDFADGKLAHAVGRSNDYAYNGGTPQNQLYISTVDFTNPDAPARTGELSVPMPGWDATARFDAERLYLTPSSYGCNFVDGTGAAQTPLDVYDVSDPALPIKLGSSAISGQISLLVPSGDRLFALGNNYDCTSGYQSPIALAYFDVSDASHPVSLGTAEFGKGWAWTPASGTFKAFTKDDAQGLVVLPFSGWDDQGYEYNNGLQLIEFSETSITTSGTAKTRGWVERGIFVKNRLVSLSNLALSVIDYTDHGNPSVVSELTLARNVVNVRPAGDNLVEVSSDFWDNDTDHSQLRVLPASQAEENVSGVALAELELAGVNPTVFHDGELSYVVSSVQHEVACGDGTKGSAGPVPGGDGASACYSWTQEVQVVDVAGGGATARGKVALPDLGGYYGWGWGWYGCGMYDWYYGSDVVQVGGDKLAFRRWLPQYNVDGEYVDAQQSLFVVDLSNPDAPSVASTVITEERDGWWGNMRAVGDQLYASHYEWVEPSSYDGNVYYPGVVRYYIDSIDLSDPAAPRVAQKINVPGFLVGASEDDPSLIYTMDYHWDGQQTRNELAVLKLSGGRAYLQGHLSIPGYTGNVFVRGSTAFFSVESYTETSGSERQLYQVDLSDPAQPVVLPSEKTQGWGWLLGVEGDRAFVTSGWANQGIDIFKLAEGAAPVFDQFVRTRGWWSSSLARHGDTAFVASGYWGTQVIDLSQ